MQRSLLGFFTGNFKFQCLLLEKKNLIDFSFKFNEIKFCTVLINWLISEKMFTYSKLQHTVYKLFIYFKGSLRNVFISRSALKG